jgi:hypothetical protein
MTEKAPKYKLENAARYTRWGIASGGVAARGGRGGVDDSTADVDSSQRRCGMPPAWGPGHRCRRSDTGAWSRGA